jgi:hypothetical protein
MKTYTAIKKEEGPTRYEVWREVLQGISDVDRRAACLDNARQFAAVAAVSSIYFSSFVCNVPTFIRTFFCELDPAISSDREISANYSPGADLAGLIAGTAIGFVGMTALIYAGTHNSKAGYGMIATNVASGLYEIGRKLYNDAEERLAYKKRYETYIASTRNKSTVDDVVN